MFRMTPGRRISGLRAESGTWLRGGEWSGYQFLNCQCRCAADVEHRVRISEVKLTACSTSDCYVEGAILEDVTVDGLGVEGDIPLKLAGCAFSRVTLRGELGQVMIRSRLHMAFKQYQAVYDVANSAFYGKVEWAIDISQAQGPAVDIKGIPGNLIRRDPQTQGLMTFEQALEGRWRSVDLSGTTFGVKAQIILESGAPDGVLIADRSSPNFSHQVQKLEELRRAGCVLPE